MSEVAQLTRPGSVWLSAVRVRRAEAAVALAISAALATAAATVPGGPSSFAGRAVAVGVSLLEGGSLLWMRRAPGRAMGVAILAGVALQTMCPFVGSWGGATVAMSSLARVRPPRYSLCGLGAMLAVAPVNLLAGSWTQVSLAGVAACVAWVWGDVGRRREAGRQAAARRMVSEERARIARELHDVVAHTVSVIVVQANAAYDGFARRPDQARDALRTIAGSGRAALNDLRRLLEVVHPEVEDDPLRPQPGLSDLEQLAAAVRSAGLAVAVHHDGTPPTVPAVVDLSAYRIVQEALTNALRHASASHAEVAVRYSPDALELEITDDGRGAAGHDEWMEGRGLTGMRERAALLRGTVDAEPLAQGGWRVHAWLPLERAR